MELKTKILDILAEHGNQSKYDIHDKLKSNMVDPFTRITTALTALVRAGQVERCGSGVYRLKRQKKENNQQKLF